MAEESITSVVSSEEKGLDTVNLSEISVRNSDSQSSRHSTLAHRRASTGSYSAVDRPLRTEKTDSADNSQKAVPHYLRASTGSCHDFCKYGRHHSSEKKEKKPFRKRIAKPLPRDSYSVQILVPDGQKKEKVNNNGPSTETKEYSSHQKPSSHSKSYSSNPRSSFDKDKPMNHKPLKDAKSHSPDVPIPPTKSFRKPKVSSDPKTFGPKETGLSGNETRLSKSKPSRSRKFPSADPPEIVKSVIFPSTAVKNSVEQGSSVDNKTSRTERKVTNVSQKRLSPVKSKPVKVKPSSSSDNSDFIRGKGRRNSIANAEIKLTESKPPVQKVSAATAANVSSKLSTNKRENISSGESRNLKMESPPKDQNRIQTDIMTKESNDEKVSEKTLHVIEAESENNVSVSVAVDNAVLSLPSPSSTESLSYTNSSSSSSSHQEDNAEAEQISAEEDEVISSHQEDNAETEQSCAEEDEVISDSDSQEMVEVQENQNKTVRKGRGVVPEDKSRSAVKLKFRSGRVVDLQSDNNSPRRLRFRRARVLSAEDGKGHSSRALKKAGANDEAPSAEVSSEKVVLKHQDVQDKKDAQGLFNNVIEETASKLVGSRKSKVKALVGAFETVISLQESKPAT